MRPIHAILACLAALPVLASDEPPRGFEVTRIAEGVHAVIRKEPVGMMFDANNAFIVNEEDVVVVDANATATSTRETIAALRRITAKPVRFVVNTHWHLDHFEGNAAWQEAYPGVEFIGHSATREELAGIGAANRAGMLEFGPGMVEALRKRLAEGRDSSGKPLDAETRAALASDSAQAARYLEETKSVRFVPPTVEVRDRLTLRRGARTIEILHLGPGHTRADLVVWLPAERIAVTGDLVVWPVPLIGNTAAPLEYAGTLEKLLALGAATYVPGHGPVQRDDAHVRLTARLAASIRDQVRAAVARGDSLEETRKRVDLEEFRRGFAGDSKLRRSLFEMYVVQPAVEGAWRQAN
jgi:glyoxylase-like metal-dependent hydrolase (beta-lactamase superfamily II)